MARRADPSWPGGYPRVHNILPSMNWELLGHGLGIPQCLLTLALGIAGSSWVLFIESWNC